MPVRISEASTKVSYVVAAYVLGIFVALSVALIAGIPQAAATTVILLLAAVAFAARNFRGEDEPVAPPRKWWRMTSRPTSGFVFAAVFFLHAISLAFGVSRGSDSAVFMGLALIYTLLGALFAYSSIRLRRVQPEHVAEKSSR